MPAPDAQPQLSSLRLDGRIVLPGDEAWPEARAVWNHLVDPQPAAILQAASPEDVVRGITAARRHQLPLAVRGTGRNLAGDASVLGGLVIDLRHMNDVGVNPGTRIVTVEGGATLGDMDRGTIGYRTAVPAGTASGTGVGGLAVGGGIGWLTRAYGLSIDNLQDVYLVTADGELVHASHQDHPDLFWAVRGAGSNFGVVTRFEFQGVPLEPEVYAGAAWFTAPRWRDALRFYADWAPGLPDGATTVSGPKCRRDHLRAPDGQRAGNPSDQPRGAARIGCADSASAPKGPGRPLPIGERGPRRSRSHSRGGCQRRFEPAHRDRCDGPPLHAYRTRVRRAVQRTGTHRAAV